MGLPEGQDRKKEVEKIFEVIKAKIWPYLMKKH